MPGRHKLVHSAEKAVELHSCAPIRLQLPTYLSKPSLPHSGALKITHIFTELRIASHWRRGPTQLVCLFPLATSQVPQPTCYWQLGNLTTLLPQATTADITAGWSIIASSRFATKAFVVTCHKNLTSRCRDISHTNPSTEYKVRVAGSHNSNDGKTKTRWFCCFFSGLKFSHLLFRAGLAELRLSKLVPQWKSFVWQSCKELPRQGIYLHINHTFSRLTIGWINAMTLSMCTDRKGGKLHGPKVFTDCQCTLCEKPQKKPAEENFGRWRTGSWLAGSKQSTSKMCHTQREEKWESQGERWWATVAVGKQVKAATSKTGFPFGRRCRCVLAYYPSALPDCRTIMGVR